MFHFIVPLKIRPDRSPRSDFVFARSSLVLWMANSIAVRALWWVDSILRRNVSTKEFWITAAAIVGLVFFTGLQSTKTAAKLALFTNKLGIRNSRGCDDSGT